MNRPLTLAEAQEAIALIEMQRIHQARRSFWAYRQLINPTMKRGWFQRRIARRLQRFRDELIAGTRPMLAIEAPPQHGKSHMIIDFISWCAGHDPDLATIYAAFSDRLTTRANLRMQRLLASKTYRDVFPDGPRLGGGRGPGAALRNSDVIEFEGRSGLFRNTTVRGSVTGEGLGLGVVDDPIKGREAARSETTRNNVWDWFTDDFYTRFSEEAGLLSIMTRWHVDDPLGRMQEMFGDQLEVMSFPALATEDEHDPDTGELLRRGPAEGEQYGDALFPEHKSREFIMLRQAAMTRGNFEALYQQSPTVGGGELFPVERIDQLDFTPTPREVRRSVRYWDKAGTRGAGAYTAGVLLFELMDGRFCFGHVFRDQLEYHARETKIREISNRDAAVWPQYEVYVEQEPGSGGKESAQRTILNLAGLVAHADRPVGDKELRAEPLAVQVQAGNTCIAPGAWCQAFLDELEDFPGSKYKDQVDAASGAFAMLVGDSGPTAGVLW